MSKSSERTDRTLLEFAPIIYVAWSDGRLTDEEIVRIRTRIAHRPMSPSVERVLEEWLNPEQPPSPAKLYGLLEMMRSVSGRTQKRFKSLTDFGRFLARSHDSKGESDPDSTPELVALREIEQALGMSGEEAMRAILGPTHEKSRAKGSTRFDAEDLAQFVDAERYDVRRYVFNVLQRGAFDRSNIDGTQDYREHVLEWCRQLVRHGVTAYGYPPQYDGEGNIPKSIAAFETLAYHDLSLLVKFGVQFGLFGGSILQLGTTAHHAKYLRAVASLDLPGCFAMTETGHGSNVRDILTTASFDKRSGEFVIDTPSRAAWKDYIGNAANHGRMATVFAQLEVNGEQHGVHAFLVPIRDEQGQVLPGVQIEDCGEKVGLNGVDNGRIAFTEVRIPRENLLDRFGHVNEDGIYQSPIESPSRRFFTMLGTLVAGRISIAAASCSSAKLGLTIGTRYAAARRQFGPEGRTEVPILSYTSVQRRLLPLIARTYALDFAVHDTVRMFGSMQPEDTRGVELRAAALKAGASRNALEALQFSRELCGGQGYLWVNRLGELRADTDIFTTFEGANNVLAQLVAKGLLTELKEQFEEMRALALIREVTARAGTAVAELNPVITRKTDEDHLLDPDFHAGAFRYRENRLLRSVAARLRHRLGEGVDPFDAVNECQDHMIKLAEAHTDRLALESFQARLETSEGAIRPLMERLCALFALSTIERDRGWFLECGYIEGVKSKAVRTLMARLCRELAEYAVLFTDGWGIPERYLPDIAKLDKSPGQSTS